MVRSLALCLLLVACGSSPPPPATHAHFEAIQRQEARQDELERSVLEGPCPQAAADADESCAAAARVCEISEGVDDRDAALRCERARERCEGHRASARRCHE
ncbi:MAG: hypothetical protein H6724_15675 [Sandaracinus sp.]|nr:hypothetical protein [Sandaracinus sp.]